jgi:hypothetical protein
VLFAAWLAASAPVPIEGQGPSAEPTPAAGVELTWSAPEGCPPVEDVRARLDALLGDRQAGAPFVRLEATVSRKDGTFALQMRTETASGISTHALSSPDCQALADGAALVAAVAADPLAVDRSLDASQSEEPELPPDEVTVTRTPPDDDDDLPRGRLRLARFALRADGLLEYGMLPKLGLGPVITAGLIGPQWRVELGAIVLVPRPVFTDDTNTAGAAIGSWSLRARGCGVPVVRIVEFPVCAGFEGGQMTARPLGNVTDNRDDRRGFGLFSFGGGFGISPRPFIALLAGVDGIVALSRPRFDVAGMLLHQPGRIGVRATVGLELRVP